MVSWITRILEWFYNFFWKEEMEIAIVGLEHSGKTTFVEVISTGSFLESTIPTQGFNMRKITKGRVTIKAWDVGGQPKFRSMWGRYCRGVNAIIFMVDAADIDQFEKSIQRLCIFVLHRVIS